jgi:hypothetical protein
MTKKLVCFDFDDTLFHTPGPEEGKNIWQQATGKEWPYIGWWGKHETLNTEIFEIPINEWVKEKYFEHIVDPLTKVIVATGRLNKVKGMRENINKIFEKNELKFHEVHLNWGGDTLDFKKKLFGQKLDEYEYDEFIMFDDRQEHLPQFENWAELESINRNINITIVDVINKTEKTFKPFQIK